MTIALAKLVLGLSLGGSSDVRVMLYFMLLQEMGSLGLSLYWVSVTCTSHFVAGSPDCVREPQFSLSSLVCLP